MVIQFTVFYVELLHPILFYYPVHFTYSFLFPYPFKVKYFIHGSISGLLYPIIFPYPVKFPYPIKNIMRKSPYF